MLGVDDGERCKEEEYIAGPQSLSTRFCKALEVKYLLTPGTSLLRHVIFVLSLCGDYTGKSIYMETQES